LTIVSAGCDLSRGTEKLPSDQVIPGHIVFASDRDEAHGEIYIMRDDGAHVARLTFNSVEDGDPLLSPDGTKLTFRRELNPASVFVMNVDGTSQVGLAPGKRAAWSPDGTKLAYVSTGLNGQAANDIYTILPNGTGALRITNDGLAKNSLAWSPDGTKLVYGAVLGVCVIPATGGSIQSPAQGKQPRWSPDGQRIVFVTNVYDGNDEIYSIRTDGSDLKNLSQDAAADSGPDWGH
jgi:TolB protein